MSHTARANDERAVFDDQRTRLFVGTQLEADPHRFGAWRVEHEPALVEKVPVGVPGTLDPETAAAAARINPFDVAMKR